jgi:integrase
MATPKAPLQYSLFDLEPDADLTKLREKEAQLRQSTDAPNTVIAYAHAWKMFTRWCADWRHCPALPASPDVVREYLTWTAEMRTPRYKMKTIQLALAAIRRVHKASGCPLPSDADISAVMSGIVRSAARAGHRPELAGKKHLTVQQLKTVCHSLGAEPIHIRNRALILLGFVSALRRSDIARLDTDNVHFEQGYVRLWIAFSKTDQLGTGRDVFLYPSADPALCAVAALKAWKQLRLEHFGSFRGPLFLRCDKSAAISDGALSPDSVCRVLQRLLDSVGIPSREYGAHSMRSGMITAAHEAGANLRAIMDRTGQKSVATVMRYIKPARGSNPLAGVL